MSRNTKRDFIRKMDRMSPEEVLLWSIFAKNKRQARWAEQYRAQKQEDEMLPLFRKLSPGDRDRILAAITLMVAQP